MASEKRSDRVLSSSEKTQLLAELEAQAGDTLPPGLRNAIQNAANVQGIITALKQQLKNAKKKK